MGKLHHFIENGNGISATITAVSGTIAVNTVNVKGTLVLVYVKATTSTTTFDFSITDNKSRVVREYKGEMGTLRDDGANLPMQGKYTLTISNASVDEAFNVLLIIEEIDS